MGCSASSAVKEPELAVPSVRAEQPKRHSGTDASRATTVSSSPTILGVADSTPSNIPDILEENNGGITPNCFDGAKHLTREAVGETGEVPSFKDRQHTRKSRGSSVDSDSSEQSVLELTAEQVHALSRGSQLGKGFYSHVDAVTDGQGREFALKVTEKKYERVALNEAHVLRRLPSHSHVVGFHGASSTGESFCLLLELCRGGDLLSHLEQSEGQFEWVKASIIKQLLLALQHLHEHDIVHRDIKPENIMLLDVWKPSDAALAAASSATAPVGATVPHVKVVDFGCVLQRGGPVRSHRNAGTCTYIAPEVLRDAPVTAAADVWGAGIVAYVLLGGYHPFDEYGKGNTALTESRILNYSWSFNDNVWESVSTNAKDFIKKILCPLPERLGLQEALAHPWIQSAILPAADSS